MKKFSSPARFLDWVFDILYWGAIAAIGITGVLAVGYALITRLTPGITPTVSALTELQLGNVTFRPTAEFLPEQSAIFRLNMMKLIFSFVLSVISLAWVLCARDCLNPMLQGTPFDGSASRNLKKLAILTCVQGAAANLLGAITFRQTIDTYWEYIFDLYGKIGLFGLKYDVRWEFLIAAAVLFLASSVFRHGDALQQLSDETL